MSVEVAQSSLDVVIQPRDPLIARDGRPFAAMPGAQAISLPWPLPSTTAGALRTRIGADLAFDWQSDGPDRARRIAVHGPLMLARWPGDVGWSAYLAAPRDALVVEREEDDQVRLLALRPDDTVPKGAGCDLPAGLRPLRVTDAGKPARGYAYWPLNACAEWLAAASPAEGQPPERRLPELPRDTRVHVKMNRQTGTGQEGFLFSTEGLVFPDRPSAAGTGQAARALLCRVIDADGWSPPAALFITLGGERRLARLYAAGSLWPTQPSKPLRAALIGARRLRLMLVTPALFAGGWKPGWLDERLEGSPPGLPDLRLRLVGAAVGRRAPVSGWNLDRKRPGPKATRYTVPAGSVYFCDVIEGTLGALEIAALWMTGLSDGSQDRADGFGLALPGVW